MQIFGVFFCLIEHYSMFYGRQYAAYARMNVAYGRTLNGVRSTSKKIPILCIWAAGRERSYEGIGFISVALVWGYKSQGRCSKVQHNSLFMIVKDRK